MYQVQNKRKYGKLRLVLLLFSAVAVGMGIGYAAVKTNLAQNRTLAAPNNRSEPVSETAAPHSTETEEENEAASLHVSAEENEKAQMPAKEGFLVKTTDGKVCVFKIDATGSTQYSHTIPVELQDLPLADREKLEKGIYLENKTELAELAEDYSS